MTVALVAKEAGEDASMAKIAGHDVAMLTRKRTTDHEDRYSIKTLISPRDQAIDLTKAQWRAALELSQETWRRDAERNEGREPPKEPRGPAIRRILGDGSESHEVAPMRNRALLMLYLLDPAGSDMPQLAGAKPIVAWAISFPGSSSERRVSNAAYVANSVAWGALNDWVD